MELNATQKNIVLITQLTRDSAIKYSAHLLENQDSLDRISKEALSKIALIEYCKCFLFNKPKNQEEINDELKAWFNDFRIKLTSGFSEKDTIIHNRFIQTRNTEWAHSDEIAFDIKWHKSTLGIEFAMTRDTDYILPKFDLEKIKSFSKLQIQNLDKFKYL